jgi:hypothetical protein
MAVRPTPLQALPASTSQPSHKALVSEKTYATSWDRDLELGFCISHAHPITCKTPTENTWKPPKTFLRTMWGYEAGIQKLSRRRLSTDDIV